MGLSRAGFEVVGFDIEPQPNYPFEFHQEDALTVDLSRFDAVWTSPPCQAYIQRNKNLLTKHPKLIEPTRERLKEAEVPYIIENVEGAPLITPLRLCGTMFGLRVRRHRLFEAPGIFELTPPCNHWGTISNGDFAGVYAFGGKGQRHGHGVRDPKSKQGPDWGTAMGIDWMTKKELTQAVPPAYAEWIGRRMLERL